MALRENFLEIIFETFYHFPPLPNKLFADDNQQIGIRVSLLINGGCDTLVLALKGMRTSNQPSEYYLETGGELTLRNADQAEEHIDSFFNLMSEKYGSEFDELSEGLECNEILDKVLINSRWESF